MKPRTFWLPDTSSEAWKQKAREDCAKLQAWYDANPEILAWVDAMVDDVLDTLPPPPEGYD